MSVGILYTGTAPDVDAATTAMMVLGAGGMGGHNPAGTTAIAGVSQATLAVQTTQP